MKLLPGDLKRLLIEVSPDRNVGGWLGPPADGGAEILDREAGGRVALLALRDHEVRRGGRLVVADPEIARRPRSSTPSWFPPSRRPPGRSTSKCPRSWPPPGGCSNAGGWPGLRSSR